MEEIMETNTKVVLWKANLDGLKDWYETLLELKNKVLKEGIDYYYGRNSGKPVLLKPGAEKISRLSGFQLETLDCIKEVIDEDYIDYTYRCVITDCNGERIGICEGSANSREEVFKYSYRKRNKLPSEEKIKEMRTKNLGFWRKIDSKWVWIERVENRNVFNIKNRIQKMAQKRAFVGAVLIAAGASEFFTQDKLN